MFFNRNTILALAFVIALTLVLIWFLSDTKKPLSSYVDITVRQQPPSQPMPMPMAYQMSLQQQQPQPQPQPQAQAPVLRAIALPTSSCVIDMLGPYPDMATCSSSCAPTASMDSGIYTLSQVVNGVTYYLSQSASATSVVLAKFSGSALPASVYWQYDLPTDTIKSVEASPKFWQANPSKTDGVALGSASSSSWTLTKKKHILVNAQMCLATSDADAGSIYLAPCALVATNPISEWIMTLVPPKYSCVNSW